MNIHRQERILTDLDVSQKEIGSIHRLRRWMTVLLVGILLLVALLGSFTWRTVHSAPAGSGKSSASSIPSSQEDVLLPIPDDAWALTVVSPNKQISSSFTVQLTSFGGIQVDKRILPALKKMLTDAKAAGYTLQPAEGYVDASTQEKRYQQKIQELMKNNGKTRAIAESEAEAIVPPGGFSENQTGMAVTFPSDSTFLASDGYHWLLNHCVDYGFVRRYADEKEGYTGLKNNPSHFRYVGTYNAQTMRRLGLCLEEYAVYKKNQQINN